MEQAQLRHGHDHAALIGGLNDDVVADRATRLDDGALSSPDLAVSPTGEAWVVASQSGVRPWPLILVRLDAASKADWDRLMAPLKPVLITLGADRGALSAVRLSRLPQAMRGERCQRLLYLNPRPTGQPIFQQAMPPACYAQKMGEKEPAHE